MKDELNHIIRLEIASIGALVTATKHQADPEYVFLYHEARTAKQANVEQLSTLLRMAGLRPTESGGILEPVTKLQTALAQRVSTTMTLRAMRLVEERLLSDYRALLSGFPEGTVECRALQKTTDRAVRQWHVLTAHIAKRESDPEEAARLPVPLGRYFAHDEAHACLRCLFDRPGEQPPILRRDPHPHTYVCGACMDEVLADLPPDLLQQADRWPAELRALRIVEKAIGKPSRLKAMTHIVSMLSGLPPEMPEKTARKREKPPATERTVAPPVERATARLETNPGGAGAAERTYSNLLFDFRSVRRNW